LAVVRHTRYGPPPLGGCARPFVAPHRPPVDLGFGCWRARL